MPYTATQVWLALIVGGVVGFVIGRDHTRAMLRDMAFRCKVCKKRAALFCAPCAADMLNDQKEEKSP